MPQLRRNQIIAVVAAVVVLIAAVAFTLSRAAGGEEAEPTTTTTSTTRPPTTTTTTAPAVLAPLTGLPSDDVTVARPAVAIKIDNVQGKSTPQAGLGAADLVYEIQVEGQVTRFLAVFQSQDAAPVGPVRSARGSEIYLLEELHTPLFTWHGANDILRPQVRASDIVPRSIDDIPQLFYRDRSRPSPYNSFVQGTAEIRATAPEGSVAPTPVLVYRQPGEAPSPHARPATHVNIRFPPPFGRGAGEAPVDYDWTGSAWARSQSGAPHVDTAGNQFLADNVIVRFTQALDSGTVDKAGTRVPTADVLGEGEAWVFTDGQVVVGRWVKPDGPTPTRYLDADGNDIRLSPGRTWISLPYGQGSSYR